MGIIEDLIGYTNAAYDWREKLEKTMQDPLYHREGNVFTHTVMVVENMLQHKAYESLEESSRKILLYAAIFHDIAKPFCTKTEDGRIVSPGHAVSGARETRKLLYRYGLFADLLGGLSFDEREQVCGLVRYHGLPIHFIDKPDIHQDIIRASLEVNLYQLSILAESDAKGRISDDISSMLERIDLFRETAEELECFHQPKKFISNRSRYKYFSHGAQYLFYDPPAAAGRAYLMSGLPASGKDTYTNNYLEGVEMISLDEIRRARHISPVGNQGAVVHEGKAKAKRLLARQQDFVWNATNLTYNMRKSMIQLFSNYGFEVYIVYCETPLQELRRRNSERDWTVPEPTIMRMLNILDVPKPWEAEHIIYHVFGKTS